MRMKDIGLERQQQETQLTDAQLHLLRDIREALIATLHDCNENFTRMRIEEAIEGINDLLT